MIDIIKNELTQYATSEQKAIHLRELLQIIILRIMYERGYFRSLAFTGGTALRILFDIKRFSEDLDFSLISKTGYSLNNFYSDIQQQLANYGFIADIDKRAAANVHQLKIRFRNVLYDLQLTPNKNQKLFIKVEIDTNPPSGGDTELTVINKLFMFSITHFTLPSLFATKLHACFFRTYIKGRDFYDLLWYLTKKVEPNYKLLFNAIKQTHPDKVYSVDKSNFRQFLVTHITAIDLSKARKDVERFIENKDELRLLEKNSLLSLTKHY